ncbi:YALIA101S02e13872g1_1 [Yarrowia lipolytica]|nr:Hypothetical protein YALI2_F00203g [Yarrowia lipolytica]SEI32281.1 YALIA101S02e13872g1_1 [Yarrowia lipolytica]
MFSPNPSKKPMKSCMKKCDSSMSCSSTSQTVSLGYKNTSTACSSSSVATDFSVSSCESSQMDSPLSSSVFSSHSTVSPDYITAYGTITPSMHSSSLGKSLSDLELSKSHHHHQVVETEDSDDTFETQFECEVEVEAEAEADAEEEEQQQLQATKMAQPVTSKYPYTSYSYEPRVFESLCDEIEQDNRGRTVRRDQKRYSYQQLCQLRQQLELLERARIAGLKGGPLDLHDVREMIDKMRE